MLHLDELLARHRGAVLEACARLRGWREPDVDISALAEWDHELIPVFQVIPRDVHDASSLLFAAMRDGTLVLSHTSDAFARIARELADAIDHDRAASLARLAVLFGAFDDSALPVGRLVEFIPAPAEDFELPRTDTHVVYEKHGPQQLVRFYAYGDQLRTLFDCTVAIDGTRIHADATLVPQHRGSAHP